MITPFTPVAYGAAAVFGLLMYKPEYLAMLSRGAGRSFDTIMARPLGARTLIISFCGASFGGAIAGTLQSNPRFDWITVASGVGALVALVAWTAMVLTRRRDALPSADPPGRPGFLLGKFGRSPWVAVAKGIQWGVITGGVIGIGVVLFHRPWPTAMLDAWLQIAPWLAGGFVVGPILMAQAWADTIGEYARTGTVPPPSRWTPSIGR